MERLRLEDFQPRLLAACNLRIAEGGTATLTGPSGSGKSLFLRAIADLDPHGGTAWLDGTPCADFAPPDWRRNVGYLPAESHWWAERVTDHLAARNEAVVDALGLPVAVYDWPVSRLSSGERQRLAIARVLAVRPRVLLLDEPTANLDRTNTARVEEVVRDYQRDTGAGIIWVSHDPDQRQRLGGARWVIAEGTVREESA